MIERAENQPSSSNNSSVGPGFPLEDTEIFQSESTDPCEKNLELAPKSSLLMDENEPASILLVSEDGAPRYLQGDTFLGETSVSLTFALRVLFGLNGFTLSLEGLGLMYIINSKVEMPIAYLPTYGAVAFLPYSFKPLYGYISGRIPRYQLFIGLLFGNGVLVLATCLIPKGGVFLACLVAFLRGVTDSWAELCLGLTLIDHAMGHSHDPQCNYEGLASKFQAQAATSRNFGSFIAYGFTFFMFAGRQLLSKAHTELSSRDANLLLVSAGTLQLLGAVLAFLLRSEFHVPSRDGSEGFHLLNQPNDAAAASTGGLPYEGSALREDEDSHASYSSQEDSNDDDSASSAAALYLLYSPRADAWCSWANGVLVVLLQITVLILALKGPITEASSHLLWKVLLLSCLLATVLVGLTSYFHQWWYSSHRVGLYLILKHAIPRDSMVLGSFFYSLFQSSPAKLQVLAFVGSGVTTFSSWSYGRLLSRYNTGSRFLLVIAGTTVLAATTSLGNIAVFQHSQSDYLIWIILVVKIISTFCGEWEFLPDVVLATTTLNHPDQAGLPTVQAASRNGNLSGGDAQDIGVKYGTLISCIDFGDQLGSLVTGPLVAFLGISRENNFERLDQLILLCFIFNILSLCLLALLRK